MTAPVREGDIVGQKYRVDRVLGAGAMGIVVAATHVRLGHAVAIKFMLPEFLGNEAVQRFLREARAAANLRSEHVARVSDVDTLESGAPYIVMEHLQGQDLAQVLEKQGPLSVRDAATYVIQACDALAEAHAAGIVHRDLKPSNLFLTTRRDGRPLLKILDFGISKANPLTEQSVAATKTNAVMGSPQYMSPEQMLGPRDVDARTDIWSLGVSLYELTSGRPPFLAETLAELFVNVMQRAPVRLRQVRPELPEAFEALVMRCLEKDREGRVESADGLARELAVFAGGGGATTSSMPARAMPIQAGSSSPPPIGPSATIPIPIPPPSPSGAGSGAPRGRAVQTAANWGQTNGDAARRSRRGTLVVLAVLGLLLAGGALGGAAALRSLSGRSASDAASPVATNGTTSASASAPDVVPVSSTPANAATLEPITSASAPAPVPVPVIAVGPRPVRDIKPAHATNAPAATTAQQPLPTPAQPTSPAPATAAPRNCKPPFFYNTKGSKEFKPECI